MIAMVLIKMSDLTPVNQKTQSHGPTPPPGFAILHSGVGIDSEFKNAACPPSFFQRLSPFSVHCELCRAECNGPSAHEAKDVTWREEVIQKSKNKKVCNGLILVYI